MLESVSWVSPLIWWYLTPLHTVLKRKHQGLFSWKAPRLPEIAFMLAETHQLHPNQRLGSAGGKAV